MIARDEGIPLAEETIKALLGPKRAWKLAKLFRVTRFEAGEWQAEAVQKTILQHNSDMQTSWLKAGDFAGHAAHEVGCVVLNLIFR